MMTDVTSGVRSTGLVGWSNRLFASDAKFTIASLTLGVVIWGLIAAQFSGFVLASPFDVAATLWRDTFSGELPLRFAGALIHMVIGFLLSIAVAIPLGLLIGRSKVLTDLIEPTLTAIFAIPIVAFVPFVIIWFGLRIEARIALVFIMCVLDMYFIVAAGARDIDRKLVDAARSFGASSALIFRAVVLPASMPFVFTALRIGVVRAINAMITAELFFAAVNLGEYMKDASNNFDSAGVIAILVILSVAGLGLQEVVRRSEAKLLPWHIRKG